MIIVEGPDKVGKSTLVKALRRALPGWETRHHGVPPVAPFQYFGWFAAGSRPRVIVDRLPWSEYAYGATYRNGSELSAHQWRLLELTLLANNARIVLLDDATEAIEGRWGKGADDPFAAERIGLLQGAFRDLAEGTGPVKSRVPSRTYWLPELVDPDTLRGTEEFASLVAEEKRSCATERANLLAPSLAAGNGSAFLLLGESGSDRDQRYTLDPPVPFRDGPASSYLWRALDDIRLRWWEGTFTNAACFADGYAFRDWLEAGPRFAATICLGNAARNLCAETAQITSHLGVVSTVRHPMYVRRFFYASGFGPWRDNLRDALQHASGPREAATASVEVPDAPKVNIFVDGVKLAPPLTIEHSEIL